MSTTKTKSGNTFLKRTKTAQKLLNSLPESQIPRAGAVVRTTLDGKTYQSFTNGHIAFMLWEELPGLPQGDGNALDIDSVIRETESQMKKRKKIDIDLADVKAKIIEHKTLNKGRYNTPYTPYKIGRPHYNAQHILDSYTILGGNIKFYNDPTKPLSRAILESENGKAVLLPLRVRVSR